MLPLDPNKRISLQELYFYLCDNFQKFFKYESKPSEISKTIIYF